MEKRTLELTHDQITVLQDALQLAQLHYLELHAGIAKKLPQNDHKSKEAALYWYDKANTFYDLNAEIQDGKFDV